MSGAPTRAIDRTFAEHLRRAQPVQWSVFGCVPEEAFPEVQARTLREPYPPEEEHGGVAGVQIHAYGDDTTGAFLMAYGTDRSAVIDAYHRAAAGVEAFLKAVWT